MKIVISGATGFIGSALTERLRGKGHQVVRLVRSDADHPDDRRWDPGAGQLDPAALDGADGVVNLSGAGVADKRWTDERKQLLRDSRIRTTELLATTIARAEQRPPVFLSGSGIDVYHAEGDEEIDENGPVADDFFGRLCRDWEGATAAAQEAGTRVAHLRTGFVLSAKGGALRKQLPLFKLGLGGRLGSGRQYQSWISITDEVGAICHLLTADVHRAVNLTAPEPVTNTEFSRVVGKVLHRPAILPVPGFALKLVLGSELAEALALTGQRVIPRVLLKSGYTFVHPVLEAALRDLLGK